MKIKAAALQFGVRVHEKAYNTGKARQLLEQAAEAGARLVVLPELWNCGFDTAHLEESAEELSGPSITMLREYAAARRIAVVGGSVIEKKQGRFYNTSVLLDQSGAMAAKYRKAHLFTYGWREQEYFSPGDEWTLCPTPGAEGLTLGMSICYDLRFPEFYRNMALRGAKLFSVPVAWPQARADEYELFCRARAAENRAYLIAANYSDNGDGEYCGHSLIVDPYGRVLARGDEGEGVVWAELDTEVFHSQRIFNPLADRRQFLDEIDNNLI